MACSPLLGGIRPVQSTVNADAAVVDEDVSVAYLAVAANLHACIVQHMAVLAAAEDAALHPSRAVDDDLGAVAVGIVVVGRQVRALAAAEDVAEVIGHVVGRNIAAVHMVHLHVVGAYLAVLDDDAGDAGTFDARDGLAVAVLDEVAHMTHPAAAIDVADDEGLLADDVLRGMRLRAVPRTRAYLYGCIAYHVGLASAAIDVADGAYLELGITLVDAFFRNDFCHLVVISSGLCHTLLGIVCRQRVRADREVVRFLRHILGRHHALLHVHIDGRIADDHGLVAAAIDIAYLRGRNDVDARVGLGETVEAGFNQGIVHGRLVVLVNAVKGRVAGFLELFLGARRPIRIISVDGIVSLVAAAVQFVDDDGLASVLYDVDGDGAAHVAALVIAADHLAIDTVSDGQDDVVVDVGIRVAAEYLGHVVHALHQHLGLSVDEGFVAAAVGVVDF